ncbi:hypothetical protein J2T17_001893 [Paenibacillus mucilaginosus]|uniref:DUF6933 domain-containing protein n=1 Tax=Paenibacillus mucilaginosus TaxID=61624 RepID=UPI003D1C62CB
MDGQGLAYTAADLERKIDLIVLKFTQALLKDMKAVPMECHDSGELSLFHWHVNIYQLNRRKHIVFINDLSRLCILIDGIRSGQVTRLQEKFLLTLRTYMVSEGIGEAVMDAYLREGSEIMISKTNSRSVLGTMKEATYFTEDDFEDDLSRLQWMNRLFYKPIDYRNPIVVFKEAITLHYEGKRTDVR